MRAALIASGKRATLVAHVGVHSFTPVLDGHVRNVDVGVLYDPTRVSERAFAGLLIAELAARSAYRLRRNAPYRGIGDGHTTALRRDLGDAYCGIELEINQRLLTTPAARRAMADLCADALAAVLARWSNAASA